MKINNVTPVNNNQNNNNNKSVAFKGGFKDFFNKDNFLSLQRKGPMDRNLFILNAFVFLLSSRLITSRDKDEKREILLRDVPTIVLAVQGVPLVQKIVADLMQKKTGFAFLNNSNKKRSGTVGYSQLNDWYKFDTNLKSGFDGFSKRLVEQGGNLKKIFSTLGKDYKTDLAKFSDNNDEFMKELTNNTELKARIIEGFKDGKNSALKKAEFLKTMTSVTGFAATLALLGICIPKLNIAITEAVNKDKKSKPDKNAVASKNDKIQLNHRNDAIKSVEVLKAS